MKSFKVLPRFLAVFGWMFILSTQAWSACPTGVSMGTWNATSGSTYNNHAGNVRSNDADYYTITNPIGGQINLQVINGTSNRQLTVSVYSDATCSTAAVWSSGTVAGSATVNKTIDVTAGVTYYLYILGSASNQDTAYTLNANKPAKGHSVSHENPFSPVFANGGLKIFGDFTSIGSSVLCQNNGSGGCNNNYTGYLYDSNLIYKNSASMTLNSSSANLTLPANVEGDEIQWAGLYWQGHIADPDANNYSTSSMVQNRQNISFKLPDNTTQSITADKVWYHDFWGDGTGTDGGFRSFYQGYKDVTSLVKNHLVSGTSQPFSVGNIKANNGTDWSSYLYVGTGAEYDGIKIGFWGNWSLIVVYKHDQATMPSGTKLKNINVFNGFDAMFPLPVSGYETFNVVIPINGFLTPKSGAVNAKMLFYASGGEKAIARDAFYIQNANASNAYQAVSNAVNPADNPFNGSVSNNGVPLDASISYYPGLDLDTYDISAYMKNNQTSTSLKLEATFSNNNGDQSTPGAIAFSSDLFTPNFCYDYGYEQNGRPFTEENNGVTLPRLVGTLPNDENISVSIYVRNTESSDITATNTKLHINNIDTNQATYVRNSTAVTFPKQYIPTTKTDAAWPLVVSDSYVKNIPIGDINGSEYFYTYYTLKPKASGDINMSIEGTFDYNLSISLADGTTLSLPYSSSIGGAGLPMCSANNFSYTPTWGIFSMVDAGLYDDTTSKSYYDLTTQVVKRPANLRIASFKPAPNLDTPQKVSTMVAVELIDAGQFHDVDAACAEPSSAITPRVWVGFENNVSQVNFDAAAINSAISNGLVSDILSGQPATLTSATDFYKTATPNAAFRITYNTLNDANGSLIDIKNMGAPQGLRIDNFSNIHQIYPHCRKDVKNPNNNGMTNDTSVACSNNGNNSTWGDIAICMECLYGADTKVLCSRDNFAIRPESYNVTLKDLNQANHALSQVFATGHTGVATPVTSQVNMDAGYVYGYEISATSHLDNTNSSGYTRYFGTADNEYNISLTWNPTTLKTGCNDTNSYSQAFNLINGMVSAEGLHSQVGEYKFNIFDKTWTAVDWDTALQGHQTGTHFLSGGECLQNSSTVPSQALTVGLSVTNTLTNLVGCNIESTHDNVDNGLKYRDYNLSFKPDHFDLTGVQFATGQEFNVSAINQNVWTYMNNIASDANMSVRYSGNVIASSRLGNSLSNFVSNCYAEPTNLDLNITFPITTGLPSWRYRLQEVNASTNQIWNDTNDVILTPVTNTSFPLITIPQTSFLKNQNGFVDLNLSLNFDRNQTLPVNPITVGLQNLQVKCQTDANCSSNADMIANHLPDANLTTNSNVTFAYGRLLTKDIRVFGNIAFTANGWYEVYNSPNLLTTQLQPSKDGGLWYINQLHDDLLYGDSVITRLESSGVPSTVNLSGNDINGIEAFSFTGSPSGIVPYNGKAHVDTPSWLWYAPNALTYSDPSDLNLDCLTHPCFNVTVMPAIGATGSAKSTNTDTKASKASIRGTGWHSTTDYAPAIR